LCKTEKGAGSRFTMPLPQSFLPLIVRIQQGGRKDRQQDSHLLITSWESSGGVAFPVQGPEVSPDLELMRSDLK
jgi:hypothetical protein